MRTFTKWLVPCCLLICLAGCSRQPVSTAEIPRHVSQSHRISVAPFTQPLNTGELISGQIPEDQGRIPQDDLLALDRDLRNALMTGTSRQYNFITPANLAQELSLAHATTQPTGLARWIEVGKQHKADYLLVPQIIIWHEREGSQAGVQKSAHARLEFFLLNIPQGVVVDRSVFEEKQVGLADNLLGMADFMRRKGQWVSARELSADGIALAIKELGL